MDFFNDIWLVVQISCSQQATKGLIAVKSGFRMEVKTG
jgi:hypothetical protein